MCKQAQDRLTKWEAAGKPGDPPEPVECEYQVLAEGWIVKVRLHTTEPPHSPASKSCMLYGVRNTEGPLHMIVLGMFAPGKFTGRQLKLCLKNLNNLEILQSDRFQLRLYRFSTHNAARQTDYCSDVFLEMVCKMLNKVRANIYHWPDLLQREHQNSRVKLKGDCQLDALFTELFKKTNIWMFYHNKLQVHIHHHRILNCPSPESLMCNDIFRSLNACAQQLMTAHYETQHFQQLIERLHEGCTSILEFL